MAVNREQPRKILDLLKRHFPVLRGIGVAVLGLAFKPGTDDMRETPALPIVKELLSQGAKVKGYDPIVRQKVLTMFPHSNFAICDNIREAITGTQAVVLLTRWSEFSQVPELLSEMDSPPVIIDGRRMLDKHDVANYEGIGL